MMRDRQRAGQRSEVRALLPLKQISQIFLLSDAMKKPPINPSVNSCRKQLRGLRTSLFTRSAILRRNLVPGLRGRPSLTFPTRGTPVFRLYFGNTRLSRLPAATLRLSFQGRKSAALPVVTSLGILCEKLCAVQAAHNSAVSYN